MPQNITDTTQTGDILHTWKIREYEVHSRPRMWYVFTVPIGLLLVIYGIFSGNFLFALIIILFAIIIFLQSHRDPISLPFSVTDLGVIVNNRFYPYTELKDFYIIYEPPDVKQLFIEPQSAWRPTLRVPLEDINPNEIRQSLRGHLLEDIEKEEEPFSDMFARRWKMH